jgi:signal transduction histidine kinase
MQNKTIGRRKAPAKVRSGASPHASLAVGLRRIERVFGELQWSERGAFAAARKRARVRAGEVLEAGGRGDESAALLVAAVELLGALKLELLGRGQEAAELIQRLEDLAGLSRRALARETLRAPELLALAPTVAIEVQLEMLSAFAGLRTASLWVLDSAGRVNCVAHIGERGPSRGAQQLAQRVLAGEGADPGSRRMLLGLSVGQRHQPVAALVAGATAPLNARRRSFLIEALPMLAAIVERHSLLSGSAAAERALVESSERKLTRLGFDLHDGPIQEVALLAQDLRLFTGQLEGALGEDAEARLVRGRIEDLEAQLGALDSSLRRLSSAVHAPAPINRPFESALRDVINAFATRTGVEPTLTLEGELELSASQQMALLNIVHEALSNIREHSGASNVKVSLIADAAGVQAEIFDNGRGFDVESTLLRAARAGRVGLVAMHERVRLLGGQCRIESRPGGPTVVSVALQRWQLPAE